MNRLFYMHPAGSSSNRVISDYLEGEGECYKHLASNLQEIGVWEVSRRQLEDMLKETKLTFTVFRKNDDGYLVPVSIDRLLSDEAFNSELHSVEVARRKLEAAEARRVVRNFLVTASDGGWSF